MSDRSDTVSTGILPGMDKVDREASWAFAQGKVGTWLLHLPSGVVGKVKDAHAPGEHPVVVGAVAADVPRVTLAVLQYEDGNAFLADPANFLELSGDDVLLLGAMTVVLRDFCEGACVRATKSGMPVDRTATLLRATLQAQLRALTPR